MRGSMRSRSCLLFFLLAVNVGAGCAGHDGGSPSAASDDVAAVVYGEKIPVAGCLDIKSSNNSSPGPLISPEMRTNEIAKRVLDAIQRRLLENLVEAEHLRPTDGELRMMLSRERSASREAGKAEESEMRDLQRELSAAGLEQSTRHLLESKLARLKRRQVLRGYGQCIDGDGIASNDVKWATTVIVNWKINKFLHQKYGGRVAVSKLGLDVAIDGLRHMVCESMEQGDVLIPSANMRASVLRELDKQSRGGIVVEGEDALRCFRLAPWEHGTHEKGREREAD